MNKSKLVYGIGLITLSLAVFFLGSKAKNSFHVNIGNTHWNTKDNKAVDSVSIAGISKLNANGSCEIVIIPSEQERVVYYYNKEEVKNLSAVKDSTLNIEFENEGARFFSMRNSGNILVKIYTHSINTIVQEGVGSMSSEGPMVSETFSIHNQGVGSMDFDVQATNLAISNEGVGSIDIKGSADNAQLDNDGTGSIDANKLVVKNAKVSNGGVGSVDVNATETLDMTNQGVGSIGYSGTAKITRSLSQGVGSISKN